MSLLWYLVLGVSGPIALATAALTWRRRSEPGALALTVMLVAVGWWSLTYLGEVLAPTLAGKLLWVRLEWLGSLVIPIAWLAFVLEYTGHDEYVTRRNVAALSVPWLVSIVLVWTNQYHHLVRVPLGLERANGLVLLDQQFGPWFFVVAAYTYVLVLVGGGLLVRMVTSDRVAYRGQALALLVAALTPLLVNAYSVFGSNVDLTPFAFAVTGATVYYSMAHYDLLEASPIAAFTGAESVIESMHEGVLVIDTRGHVVRANDAVERLLGIPRGRVVGEPMGSVLADWDGDNQRQVVRSRPGRSDLVLDVSASTLTDRHGRVVGRTVVLRDVSDRHEHHERIEVMNRVLRHNLRNEVSLVLGYLEQLEDELDGERPDAMDHVEDAARRLLAIGNRARQAQQYLGRSDSFDWIQLTEVVAAAVEEGRRRHPDATIDVEAFPEEPVSCPAMLEPVLENLIDNGLRHDPADTPVVTVRVDVEGETLIAEIADSGPGIPDNEKAVLTAGSETPLEHGSGLGLWLVKWCLSQMDGSLSFGTPADGGTTVIVRVPLSEGKEPRPASSVDPLADANR